MRVREFINYGGKTRNKAVMEAKVSGMSQNNKVTQLAGLYWDLLVQTHYLKEETYLNIVQNVPYREVAEVLGDKGIRTIIYRDKQRLQDDIGLDICAYIEGGNYSNKETDGLMTIVESLLHKQETRDTGDLLRDLNIDFNQFTYFRNLEMDDMAYIQMVDRLALLSKKYTEMVVREMDSPEIMGYIKYLLGTNNRYLTEQDKQRKITLMQAWWLTDGE